MSLKMNKNPAVVDWAEEVESENVSGSHLIPQSSEVIENGFKIVTTYHKNEEGKVVKTIRTFKIEKRLVSKNVAIRKTWVKFGDAKNEAPGPNAANTFVSERIDMQFISATEEDKTEEDEGLVTLKGLGKTTVVKCRTCGGDHWTSKCPLKDTTLANEKLQDRPNQVENKYVPPSMRAGANRAEGLIPSMEESTQIKIMNLSESTTESDLHDLVQPFGAIHKIFLARDKQQDICRGFAYVTFRNHRDAARALATLHKHRYDHLILDIEWAKPKENSRKY